MEALIHRAAHEALVAYIQSVTGRTHAEMTSREKILSDAMADLAKELESVWSRDLVGVWHWKQRSTS